MITAYAIIGEMKNEPIILADKVLIGLSTVADGDIDVRKNDAESNQNAQEFLTRNGFDVNNSALVYVTYDRENYTDYAVADETWAGKGMKSDQSVQTVDGLATQAKDLGLFLPLADCLGAVLYDPEHCVLGVTHLGRHATEANGATKFVEFLNHEFDSDPAKLQIWLSPAAGAENYPLYKLDNKSLRVVNIEQFLTAGVKPENITGADIDTTTDENFFSHSSGDICQRFAIVAKII
jgi:hypothetical protein